MLHPSVGIASLFLQGLLRFRCIYDMSFKHVADFILIRRKRNLRRNAIKITTRGDSKSLNNLYIYASNMCAAIITRNYSKHVVFTCRLQVYFMHKMIWK